MVREIHQVFFILFKFSAQIKLKMFFSPNMWHMCSIGCITIYSSSSRL